MKRLGKIIIRTGVEPRHAVANALSGGEQDNGNHAARLAQLAQNIHTAHVGQHDVEKKHIVCARKRHGETIVANVRDIGTVTAFAQYLGHRLCQTRCIFNQQHAHRSTSLRAQRLSHEAHPALCLENTRAS